MQINCSMLLIKNTYALRKGVDVKCTVYNKYIV